MDIIKIILNPTNYLKQHLLKNMINKSNQIIFGYVARFILKKNHKFLFDCLNTFKKKKIEF